METAPQIDFQGMAPLPAMYEAVAAHVAALEKRFGRITTCRVVVKGPTEHHRSGAAYEIHIRLGLPDGREVNVSRTPGADERHADPAFAINDAFKRARRRLQDRVRKMQGKIKEHEGPPTGTVTSIDQQGGFGFIATADGREIYFHQNSVLNDGFRKLEVGSRVSFAEEVGEKGPQASTVHPLGKHGLR